MKKFFQFFCTVFLLSHQAFAGLSFQISADDIPKTKILFLGFDPIAINPKSTKEEIAETVERNRIFERIKKNLASTELFEIVNQENKNPQSLQNQAPTATNQGINLAKEVSNIESLPDFEKYNKNNVGAVVIAQFNYDQSGNLEARLRMWDVLDKRQLFGKFYTASKDNYRRMANTISDEIYKAITGERIGYFNSQIIYVAESGSMIHRSKKINIIDFDGENIQPLTTNRDLVLSPIFSKKPGEVFYVRYFENHPQIFSLNTRNLRSQKIGSFRNANFTPNLNPTNPDNILLTAAIEGNSDIYELNIPNNSATRLTKNPAIDTTPSYSPNGKLISFTSDRDGGQQIYIMDNVGSSIRRISFGGGSYSKPVWSPDGKFIAFTRIKGGEFSIGIIQPDGSGEKLLASGYLVEGARWSPGSRHLIYSKKKSAFGKDSIPKLYIVDIITGSEYQIPTPENEGATDPDWALN